MEEFKNKGQANKLETLIQLKKVWLGRPRYSPDWILDILEITCTKGGGNECPALIVGETNSCNLVI